jgi:hypothetical protein
MTHQDQELELDHDEDQGSGPNPPRQVTVNVILQSVNPTQFDLQPTGADPLPPPEGPNKTLTFKNVDNQGVGHNGLDISFVFTDATQQNYAFPPNNKKQDAISSQQGATNYCPFQGMNEVLSVINVSGPNNNTLRVHNPNQKIPGGRDFTGEFSYVLWVTKDGGATYLALDPGGINMNGSTT